mgnify:FL=1
MPVFPLPGVVFFPSTVLPLQVFEPRYRTMVLEAMGGERLLAVALLRPGWEEDYEGSPEFHSVGTIGRIAGLEPLHGGRCNLRLVGLQRARLGEAVREAPYRVVRVEPLDERAIDESDPRVTAAKLELLASHGCLLRELTDRPDRGAVLDERTPFEAVVNAACAGLPVDPALRQALLEESDLLERHRRASEILDEILARVLRLKQLRSEDEGGDPLH